MPYNGLPGLSLVLVSSSWVRSKRRLFTLAICRLAIFHCTLTRKCVPPQSKAGVPKLSVEKLIEARPIYFSSKQIFYVLRSRAKTLLTWVDILRIGSFLQICLERSLCSKITRSDSPKISHLTCFIQSDKVIAACLAMKLINDIGLNG